MRRRTAVRAQGALVLLLSGTFVLLNATPLSYERHSTVGTWPLPDGSMIP